MKHEVTITTDEFNALRGALANSPELGSLVSSLEAQIRAKPYFFGQFEEDDSPEFERDELPGEDMDGDFDSGMASAGFGTDEDYGYFGEMGMNED